MASKDKDIDKVLEYLENNCRRKMSLEEISHRCGCSKQYIENIYASAMKKLRESDCDILSELKVFLKSR